MKTAPTARSEEAAGELVLGRYRLRRRLGSGAFGTVWAARDERLERDVAVKEIPRERISADRFEREARAAARLTHPGIVTLYEAGADDEGVYLVSELIRGATLDRHMRQGRLSDRAVAEIGLALCAALHHAHDLGVVHRDVKPSNVLIPSKPSTPAERAKLTDFGVARVLGGDTLTLTGDVIGTAAYMAPEQADGRAAAAPADIFALAVLLYEALTGANPVAWRPARPGRAAVHLPPMSRQRRDLPRELGRAIDTALHPRPECRGTIEDLAGALAAAGPLLGEATGVVAPPRSLNLLRRTAETDREPLLPAEPAVRSARRPARLGRPSGGPDRGRLARDRAASPSAAARELLRTGRLALPAATAALAAAWLAAGPLRPVGVAPAPAALAAALAVLALPRLGYLATACTAVVLLAAGHESGLALAIGALAAVGPVLLPRHGRAWPLPLLAAGLGAVGMALAWPALAALSRRAVDRAALGAAGWVIALLASAPAGRSLVLTTGGSPFPHGLWVDSAAAAARDVLAPAATSGAWLVAAVWALAAATLPLIPRRGDPLAGAAAAVAWSAALAAASWGVLHLAAPAAHLRDMAAGALVCALSAFGTVRLLGAAAEGSRGEGGSGAPAASSKDGVFS